MFSCPNSTFKDVVSFELDNLLEQDTLSKQCQFSMVSMPCRQFKASLVALLQDTEAVDQESSIPEAPWIEVQ